MADPLSILGAAAAAGQFVEQGINLTKFLWDLYSKMQDAPESVRKQIVQIEQLLGLSRLFLQNPTLQTAAVASILGTCLQRAQEFQKVLVGVAVTGSDGRFVKIKKSLDAVMKDKKITALFENLEREKSALMLCIQEIDS